MRNVRLLIALVLLFACENRPAIQNSQIYSNEILEASGIVVLGIAQDAGAPQIGCQKTCCTSFWGQPQKENHTVSSLAYYDHSSKKYWVFDASPDFKSQTMSISKRINKSEFSLPEGIFLTHGHIGHYTGLMYLGRESMNAQGTKVYAMPKMKGFLENNGPWSQLVSLENIVIEELSAEKAVQISSSCSITPLLVPHRGEYTETVGYLINNGIKSVLFIPDIDKWNKWEKNINDLISRVDFAFLDATFYANGEVGNRDMSEIPHPFVEESLNRFEGLSKENKSKVYFIHFNHTNPLLRKDSEASHRVIKAGYNIAREGMFLAM